MQLSKLLKDVKIIQVQEKENIIDVDIQSLCVDSRKVSEKSLFFCLTGGNTDGHTFAEEAVKKGAVALVVEKPLALKDSKTLQIVVENSRSALSQIASAFYDHPSRDMKIIGITGTNGKTTTSYMLASVLEASGKKVGVIGTLGVRFDGEFEQSDLTTPDPIELHKSLAKMKENKIEYVVMEVSAHALHYHKICGIDFTACIFTNLTQDHLDFFPSMRAYKTAKSTLFLDDICPIAIINGDDEAGRKFGEQRTKKTVYYGLNTPVDAFAIVTHETLKKSECMLNINDKLCRISLAFVGRHNIYNALASATCAVELGIPLTAVAEGLRKLNGVRGRLERIADFNGGEIFVDFAHTPDGLEKSLVALKPHCKGKLICLFGCGGNRDKSKRPIMGETVAKRADFTILTSDNPRYEDPLDIIADIEKGYRRFSVKYVVVQRREKAIEYALGVLKKGDILLVAGKGGEDYQEIMGIKYPFNDNDIIEKIIEEKENVSTV